LPHRFELIRDLSLDTEGLGLMSASFFYAFAITQIPISLLLDKVGPRRLMTFLTLLGILGAVIFSLADSLSLGLIGRILLGVGMACNLMGTFKLLTEWFEPLFFATLTGLVVATGTFGNIIATTPLTNRLAAKLSVNCRHQSRISPYALYCCS
jgi:MFS family permease